MNQPEDFDQPEELNQPEELSDSGESFAELEQYLRQALQRVDPPDGFRERTLARTQQSVPVRAKVFAMAPRRRLWASGAVAAAVLGGILVAEQIHVHHQRERTELARQQFEAAMRITDHALEHARQQLQHAGVRSGE